MKVEKSSVISSCLMGILFLGAGILTEPVLSVIGLLIIGTAAVAGISESCRRKYYAVDSGKENKKEQENRCLKS